MNYHDNTKALDFMGDIETLATTNDAVILSIGGILFNAFTDDPLKNEETGEILCPHFYTAIHIPTQKGRRINPDTEKWWNSPSRKEAKAQIYDDPNKMHLVDALDGLWDFMKKGPNGETVKKGWGCAPSFDQAILGHAMRTTGIKDIKGGKFDLPIAFWDEMDVRTVEQFVIGEKYRSANRTGTYHHALDDCITQAKMVRVAGKVVRAGIDALGGVSAVLNMG